MLLHPMKSKLSVLSLLLVLAPAASAAETPPAAPVALSPAVLPGRGLAQHDFLYAGEWDFRHPDQTMFVVRGGKVVWTYTIKLKDEAGEIAEFSDATMLSNGNILFARKTGAGLVTPEKKLWMPPCESMDCSSITTCTPCASSRISKFVMPAFVA